MRKARASVVSGQFYPDDPGELAACIRTYLAAVPRIHQSGSPKALIVPHAGYVYSGPVAAFGYAQLGEAAANVERVILLGPSHRVPFRGLALPRVDVFTTPLGPIPIDSEVVERLARLPQVRLRDDAHEFEHSLEVQLPFLQEILGEFRLVPLSVGEASAEEVAEVLEAAWGGEETLVVVSSDLSHYHDYETARHLDRATTQAIERLEPAALGADSACGRIPVQGLLLAARDKGLTVETLDLRNSGDTAGPRDRVVGYGAYALR